MLLRFCLDHGPDLDPTASLEALASNRAALARHGRPLDVDVCGLQVVLRSTLWARLRASGGRIVDGRPVPILDELPPLSPAEHARLLAKGRVLLEHCLEELSSVCLTGFLEHELRRRGPETRGLTLELLAWILEERLRLASGEDEEAVPRVALMDHLVDLGVAILHGWDRIAAERLCAAGEPETA
jgi:hypothetical protein